MIVWAGCIYWVPDERVRMPPEENRTFHNTRTALVVSGPGSNSDESWPIVMICPVSSGSKASGHDVRVGAGFGGLKVKGWVRVALTQPILKSDLGDCLSTNPIPTATLRDVYAGIFSYLEPPL